VQPEPRADAGTVVVEETVNDPIASLSRADLWVTIADQSYRMKFRPAAFWLERLLGERIMVDSFIPAMVDRNGRDDLMDRMVDGEVDDAEIIEAFRDALSLASGRSWWFTLNLVAVVKSVWAELNGQIVRAGIDPYRVTLGAWLDAVWTMVLENIDKPEERSRITTLLNNPPEGYVVNPSSEDNDDAFFALVEATRPF